MTNDSIHTQLAQPKAFRKALLETALASVETTKTFEELLHFQEEKQQVKEEIAQSLEQLQAQVCLFVKTIPPIPEEFISKQHRLIQRAQLKHASSVSEKNVTSSSIQQEKSIDDDIAELRARLQRLQM
ncbi:MAG: hypothetical protein AABW64_00830 [Nanoarchaeota archaeon]